MPDIRAFIAIELDEPVKTALADVQRRLREAMPRDSVRWVRPGGVHLTLKFLGNVPAGQVADITRAIEAAAGQGIAPFSLTIGQLGCFPNLRRPRVVWVGVQEPTGALARLQGAVEKHIAPLGYPTEKRPFSPHLTLGRTQRRASPADVRRIGEVVGAAGVGQLAAMEVRAVGLIRSDLKPTGAVYTRLAEVLLG